MTPDHLSVEVAPGFEPVVDAFVQNFSDDLELGAGFAAYQEDALIVSLTAGFATRAKDQPWTAETIVPVYSVTKGIAALVLARLVDQGQLDYDRPVAELWPEFAAHGKDAVTVAETLSHQAGLPGFAEPIDPALWLDPPALAARLAAEPPLWTPGDGSGYHPLTWGYLAGEIAKRAAGRSLGTILREDICVPLGIDFQIGTAAHDAPRIAALKRPTAMPDLGDLTEAKRIAFLTKWAAPDRGGAAWREIEIPSANGHGTAPAVARLYSAYANGGQIGDLDLFGKGTFEALRRPRVSGLDRVLPFDMSFGCGIMRNNNRVFGPNPDALGHSGWGGSAAFGDPDRQLSAAYIMNRQSNILLGDPRSTRLFEALYGCL
ncbi:MAG: serine hydrolase domain-containing protein [Pseudomonadota bacterium]